MINILTSKYSIVILVALLLSSTHIYCYRSGTMNERDKWNARVAELEAKNKEMTAKSKALNEKIVLEEVEVPVEKVITRNKVIKEDILIPIEKDCSIPEEAIDIYNESIRSVQ